MREKRFPAIAAFPPLSEDKALDKGLMIQGSETLERTNRPGILFVICKKFLSPL